MRLCALLPLAAAACTDPTFPNDLSGTSSADDLRMHVEVHQRVIDGAPSTHFIVWVNRSTRPVTVPPNGDASVLDAIVEVGGEQLVPTTLVNDRYGNYEATIDHWISNIHVRATAGDDVVEIDRAEMLSNPDEMEVDLPDQLTAGAEHELHWTEQGRPVIPWVMVGGFEPARLTFATFPSAVEDGSLTLAAGALPFPGLYRVNLMRMVDYFHVDDDERLTATAFTYWSKLIEAVPPPIL